MSLTCVHASSARTKKMSKNGDNVAGSTSSTFFLTALLFLVSHVDVNARVCGLLFPLSPRIMVIAAEMTGLLAASSAKSTPITVVRHSANQSSTNLACPVPPTILVFVPIPRDHPASIVSLSRIA